MFLSRTTLRGFAVTGGALRAPTTASLRFASTAAASAPTETPSDAPAKAADAAPQPTMEELRLQAKKLYKELHRLGRDYPDAEYDFNKRLRRAYEKNASITDPEQLKKQLQLAEHIKKEILSMYSLRKYRHLRRAYHPNEAPRALDLDNPLKALKDLSGN